MALPNEPITRQEMYLSNIAGQNTALPDAPITREEMYLDYIAKTGGTGEGDMKKSIYDSDNSVATAGGIKMFVNQKIGTLPQRVGSLETTAGVLEGEVASIEDTLDTLGTASTKNSTSVVTESSDLVESGAVKDIVGWGNKNYFTAEGITTAYYLNQNGTTTSSTNWRITDYIDISDLSNIELKGIGANGNTPSLCFYDSNKVYISGVQYKNRTDIITVKPSNAAYIRVSVFVDDMETIILTHASVDATKCDNSVIGTVEDGTNPTRAYAVGEHMLRGGKFCTVTVAVTTSSTWTLGGNYVEGDVADIIATKYLKASIASGETNITIDNTQNYVIQFGHFVYINVRITVAEDITGTSGHRLLVLPIQPKMISLLQFSKSASPYELVGKVAYTVATSNIINAAGLIPAGTYDIGGITIV